MQAVHKDIRVKVNDEWQGYIEDGTHAINYILSLGMEDLKYMSMEAILDWISGALELAEEMLAWKKDATLKRRIVMYRRSLEHITTRERAVDFFINVALACEGLGTLNGFGMANVESNEGRMKTKSKIMINPEKKSYR